MPSASTIGPEPNRPKVRLAAAGLGSGVGGSSGFRNLAPQTKSRELVSGDRLALRLRR